MTEELTRDKKIERLTEMLYHILIGCEFSAGLTRVEIQSCMLCAIDRSAYDEGYAQHAKDAAQEAKALVQ